MRIQAITSLVTIVCATQLLAQRAEIIIPAANLAAAGQMAEEPTPGKWWLNRNARGWGARNDTILMTGEPNDKPKIGARQEWTLMPLFCFVPYRVPELVIDPKANGWYRIHVGLYREDTDLLGPPLLQGKLSGEPFPEFLQAPRGFRGRTAEAYWKPANLTGKTIHILQPPGPMPHVGSGYLGGITHLRMEPMTDQEVVAARREIELPPVEHRLFGMLDTVDAIFWHGDAQNEDDIRAVVWQQHQAGFGRVYWRAFGSHLDNSLSVPAAAPRWTDQEEQAFMEKQKSKAGWMPYIDLARRFDPLKVAVEYGREIGCDVHAMVRFNNFSRPPLANFFLDHPEFRAQRLVSELNPATGKKVAVKPYKRYPAGYQLSLAYPEVRTFYVSFFKQLASTGTKGIMIDLLRHPPIAGFEPIVSEAFKKKYGEDMEPLIIENDPKIQEHMAGYMRLFLVELRQAIGSKIEISVRCTGPNRFGLRGQEFVEAGLVNTIVDAHWYSLNGPRRSIDETVEAVGTRGKAMAGAEFTDVDPWSNWRERRDDLMSPGAITALAKAYSGRGVAAFGLYESNAHVWSPDVRRAIRAAGWDYDPRKTQAPKSSAAGP